MNIGQTYENYRIPQGLQKHMLRVASLSQIIVENWQHNTLDSNAIMFACVFHDMANIIKFDLNKPSLFKEEEGQTQYLKQVQKEVIQKYGTDVHFATITMCKEIGLSQKTLLLIQLLEWDNTKTIVAKQDFESAIPLYCDMRMGPHGILSLEERFENLRSRNKSHNLETILISARLLETMLQRHCSVNLQMITDNQLNERFSALLDYSISYGSKQ